MDLFFKVCGPKPRYENLTEHPIRLVGDDGSLIAEYPPSGTVARVATQTKDEGKIFSVPLIRREFTAEVTGLPEPQLNVIYIVSSIVASHPQCAGRLDLFSPGDLVRENGVVVGCRNFCVQQGFSLPELARFWVRTCGVGFYPEEFALKGKTTGGVVTTVICDSPERVRFGLDARVNVMGGEVYLPAPEEGTVKVLRMFNYFCEINSDEQKLSLSNYNRHLYAERAVPFTEEELAARKSAKDAAAALEWGQGDPIPTSGQPEHVSFFGNHAEVQVGKAWTDSGELIDNPATVAIYVAQGGRLAHPFEWETQAFFPLVCTKWDKDSYKKGSFRVTMRRGSVLRVQSVSNPNKYTCLVLKHDGILWECTRVDARESGYLAPVE